MARPAFRRRSGAAIPLPCASRMAGTAEAGLEAQRERRYEEAARLARIAGRLAPGAPQPDLLRAAALGTLWVLEGEKRAALEAEARAAFASWRSRRPAGAPTPRFFSPALRERLERPVPVPSHG